MTNKKNKPSIFISYSWDDKAISEKLKSRLLENGFKVITDDKMLSYKGSIYDLMSEKIDNAKYIIILLSDSYLKSKHCMFEFNEISRNQKFSSKCFPLIIKDTNLFSDKVRDNYIFYWNNEIINIEKQIKKKDENSNELNLLWYDYNICSNNKYKINTLFDYLQQMYTFELDDNSDEEINVLAKALGTKCKIDNQKASDDDAK